jgi:hypothetical protein
MPRLRSHPVDWAKWGDPKQPSPLSFVEQCDLALTANGTHDLMRTSVNATLLFGDLKMIECALKRRTNQCLADAEDTYNAYLLEQDRIEGSEVTLHSRLGLLERCTSLRTRQHARALI